MKKKCCHRRDAGNFPSWYSNRMMIPLSHYVVVFSFSVLLGPAGLTTPLQAGDAVPYQVTIEGIEAEQIVDLIESGAETFTLQESPPASVHLLDRRAQNDVSFIAGVLKAQGFYRSSVSACIREDATPVEVVFSIDPGPVYLLESGAIATSPSIDVRSHLLPDLQELGIELTKPASTHAILNAERLVLRWFRRNGYPFPEAAGRTIAVSHEKRAVSVVFTVNPGPPARFGSVEITGLASVQEGYVRRKIAWKADTPFDILRVEETRDALIRTDLFAVVQVQLATVDSEGSLPMIIQLQERVFHTIRTGVSYTTDEGLRGKMSWEHRNIFHQGERVSLSLIGSDFTSAAEGSFRKEEFIRSNQALIAQMRIAEDRPEAFTSRSLSGALFLERLLTQDTVVGGGMRLQVHVTRQLGETDRFGLVSLPLFWEQDTSDSLLDPRAGWRLSLRGAPYLELYGDNQPFYKGSVVHRHYRPLFRRPLTVLALRTALGIIVASDRDEVPPDERFYAGGGSSVRGYEFQSVGPREDNDPIGGRSLFEISLEGRLYLTDSIGAVLFADGGSAFSSQVPDFHETVRWGLGAGLRYFTRAGPVRVDIAFPLSQRSDMDDSYQLYVSFGQSF
ncbi:MAG TPA: BamA/TamA family outer membrane protein [Thermodesulfobacteriota bacterium]|nr:BamA/TamA family outer membrane protein [Thermodesulfobacteriota bacterium]